MFRFEAKLSEDVVDALDVFLALLTAITAIEAIKVIGYFLSQCFKV